MSSLIDEEMQLQIQSFTSWAQSRGLYVVGALIGPKDSLRVRIFATAPMDVSPEGHKAYVEKLLKVVNHALNGKSEGTISLPLVTN